MRFLKRFGVIGACILAVAVLAIAGFLWQAHRGVEPAGAAFKPSSNSEANAAFALSMQGIASLVLSGCDR